MITFLLVPLYTYYISPDDFGYYDIVLTLTFLAMGFITFQLRDGTFRFLLDNEDEYTRKGVVSFSYKLMAQSSLVVLLVGIVFSFFYDIRDWGCIVAFVITLSLYEVEVQIVRGLGQNKSFVLAGILTAFQIGLYSLIFVAWLRMGIAGIFCSNILSRLVTMVIIEFRARVFKRYFIVSFRDKSLNRALLKYSLPLLPNAVCWWLLGSSSRLFIEHFLGLEANGIFAVAMKFSTILETFSVIVYQAWQETAIKQYGAADRSKFFSRIFNTYILILSVLALIFVFVLKINYSWLVDSRYLDPMFISVICFALASFYDLGYQCSKQTVRNLPGVITTTGLNLIMNYVFIRFMGIWGIVLSSILSYLFMLGFRIIDTWKFFPVKVSLEIIYPILFLIGGAIVFYRVDSIILQIIYIRQELQMKIKALFN